MTWLGWILAGILAIYSTAVTVGYLGLRDYLDSTPPTARENPGGDAP